MTYHPTASTAVHALDQIQQLAAQKQYSWLSGADTTLSGATGTIETTVSDGTVVFGGETINIESTTLAHSDGDTQQPRWDAIVVTDSAGTLEVIEGVPAEPVTDEQGNTITGEAAFKPAPSDAITTEMVALALVWIPAGATTNGDLTEEIVDRRVNQAGRVEQTTRSATIKQSGWHTIASVAPLGSGPSISTDEQHRSSGLFTVRCATPGQTGALVFWAGQLDSEQPTINVIKATRSAVDRSLNGIRIVSSKKDSTDGAMLQIDTQLHDESALAVEYTLQNNYMNAGWWPENWQQGSIPPDFHTTTFSFERLNFVTGIATDWNDQARWGVERDGNVSMRDLNREKVGGRIALSNNTPISGEKKIPFNMVVFDDGSHYDGSGGYVVNADGTFIISASARLAQLGTGADVILTVRINGTSDAKVYHAAAEERVTLTTSCISRLSEGDVIEVFGETSTNARITGFANETFLSVGRLG